MPRGTRLGEREPSTKISLNFEQQQRQQQTKRTSRVERFRFPQKVDSGRRRNIYYFISIF